MSDDTLQQLLDEKAATLAVLALTRAVDERDWDGVRAAFAPSVLFDMSSMGGGPATDTPGAEPTRLPTSRAASGPGSASPERTSPRSSRNA